MTTQQIIWTVVIVVAALALIGFIVSSMRKRSREDNRARAAELRDQADSRAAVIPDAQARAQEAEAQAEQAGSRPSAPRSGPRRPAARWPSARPSMRTRSAPPTGSTPTSTTGPRTPPPTPPR